MMIGKWIIYGTSCLSFLESDLLNQMKHLSSVKRWYIKPLSHI